VSRVFLLDVNVLVALFDPDHVHHDLAHDWFAESGRAAWATCPVTQNGFVRVLANPAYGAPVARASELVDRLRTFCGSGGHAFWPDDVSLTDTSLFVPAMLAGHRQLTDIYLLGLAVRKRGHLATFDRTIPLKAVRGAGPDSLQVIAPVEGA
jgi:toxin-antitoxin system PIN domain toxin